MTPEAEKLLVEAAFHAWINIGQILKARMLESGMLDFLQTDYEALTRALRLADPKLSGGTHPSV